MVHWAWLLATNLFCLGVGFWGALVLIALAKSAEEAKRK